MSAAGRFAMELDAEFEREVEGKLRQVTQKVAVEALSRVVLKSPVKSGRFRGNWQVTIGAETDEELDVEDKSGQPTINAGTSVITGLSDLDVIHLQNNLPYAERIENGWSQQAPQGVVALTVAELESMFARVD